ncbi:MAG: hypothetical protein AAGJ09_07675 [Pseudomonadota bacterium]
MTNLSTLRNYKLSVALIDTGWGGAVSAIQAAAQNPMLAVIAETAPPQPVSIKATDNL